ncbi:hypothetical protein [Sphingomonas sp. ID0503]|uniref:hypothetical protein n=1 Tax=Sphingomonas sp. ID0503 TaxID=3399691 RepID=UPI003AFA9C08
MERDKANEDEWLAVLRPALRSCWPVPVDTFVTGDLPILLARLSMPRNHSAGRPAKTLEHEEQSVTKEPLTGESPEGRAPNAGNQQRDPRQDAGRDRSIADRLEQNPFDVEANLDNALDETMDASDPVEMTQPVRRT